MPKFEFDLAPGREEDITDGQEFIDLAAREFGLEGTVVNQHGPSGWPVVVITGERSRVLKFAVKHYDDQFDDLELHEVK